MFIKTIILITFLSIVFAENNSTLKYIYNANLPDRLQWIDNDGYCGEVSVAMALLKFGSYMSQYDIRDVATLKKNTQQSYYLVGENDQLASTNLKLNSIEYNHDVYDSKEYLLWVKKMVKNDYPVTITVYMNNYLFYGMTDPDAGFPDYDHIVSVAKIESNYDDDLYHDDDIITMSDHGLWAPDVPGPPYPYPFDAPYYFSYTFKDFQKTRQDANKRTGEVYALPLSSPNKPYAGNFGIAHSGIIDDDKTTFPIHIETNVNFESPQIGRKSDVRPDSMELNLKITISNLTAGIKYNLYKYNDVSNVPTSMFNSLSNKYSSMIPISVNEGETTYTMTEIIQSNEEVIYRCVKADSN